MQRAKRGTCGSVSSSFEMDMREGKGGGMGGGVFPTQDIFQLKRDSTTSLAGNKPLME